MRHGSVGCSIMNAQRRKHFECGGKAGRFARAKKEFPPKCIIML